MEKVALDEQLYNYEYIRKVHLEPNNFSTHGLIYASKIRRLSAVMKFKKDIDRLYEFD